MTVTLGGSRVADAIGLGWSSPIRLFGEITGKPGFAPREDTEAMRLGRRLQPVIFAELNDNGYPCREYPTRTRDGQHEVEVRVCKDQRPWLIGHPDGHGLADLHGAVIETKAQAYPHADMSAKIQTLVYEHLGDYSTGFVATLAGLRVEVEEVPRDEESIGRILGLVDRFWEYVQADKWPPPTGHPDDRAALSSAYPKGGGKIRETRAVREARRELAMLNAADGKHGARTRRKNFLAGIVTAHMGEAEHLISAEGEQVAKWTRYDRTATDWKAAALAAQSALADINANALSWHGDDAAKGRALGVIASRSAFDLAPFTTTEPAARLTVS